MVEVCIAHQMTQPGIEIRSASSSIRRKSRVEMGSRCGGESKVEIRSASKQPMESKQKGEKEDRLRDQGSNSSSLCIPVFFLFCFFAFFWRVATWWFESRRCKWGEVASAANKHSLCQSMEGNHEETEKVFPTIPFSTTTWFSVISQNTPDLLNFFLSFFSLLSDHTLLCSTRLLVISNHTPRTLKFFLSFFLSFSDSSFSKQSRRLCN